jgi:hypothetical protein
MGVILAVTLTSIYKQLYAWTVNTNMKNTNIFASFINAPNRTHYIDSILTTTFYSI